MTPRILVADDDRMTSFMLSTFLRHAAYDVDTTFDVPATIARAAADPLPDVLVVDLQMPGGSGVDVVRALRTSPRTEALPVVVLSGTILPETRSALERLGVRELLLKPVEPGVLVGAVTRVLPPDAEGD